MTLAHWESWTHWPLKPLHDYQCNRTTDVKQELTYF